MANKENQPMSERVIYPTSREALATTLSKIELDGSVLQQNANYNEKDQKYEWVDEWFSVPPYEPMALDELPDDVWSNLLLETARKIELLCRNVGIYQANPNFQSEDIEQLYRSTAHTLTHIRHNHRFLEKAASLVLVDNQRSIVYPPRLPVDYYDREQFQEFRGFRQKSRFF